RGSGPRRWYRARSRGLLRRGRSDGLVHLLDADRLCRPGNGPLEILDRRGLGVDLVSAGFGGHESEPGPGLQAEPGAHLDRDGDLTLAGDRRGRHDRLLTASKASASAQPESAVVQHTRRAIQGCGNVSMRSTSRLLAE